MTSEIASPEVPFSILSVIEAKHTKLIARCYSTSKEFKCDCRIYRISDTLKMLASCREAYDHIVCTTFKNSSVTSISDSWDKFSFCHHPLLMYVFLSHIPFALSYFRAHLIAVSDPLLLSVQSFPRIF